MGGSRCDIFEESIADDFLFMPIYGLYRVTRDWLQVKAAGQLRSRFETAEQWREKFAANIDCRTMNDHRATPLRIHMRENTDV